MRPPFIPKDDPEMPDAFGVHVKYVNGKEEKIDAVKQWVGKEIDVIEFLTFEDERIIIPYSSIQTLHYDKRYTKVLELNAKAKADAERKAGDRR